MANQTAVNDEVVGFVYLVEAGLITSGDLKDFLRSHPINPVDWPRPPEEQGLVGRLKKSLAQQLPGEMVEDTVNRLAVYLFDRSSLPPALSALIGRARKDTASS